MKLFFTVLAVALLVSSGSAFLFGKSKQKQGKVVDISIHKEHIPAGGGQAPVGQVPVGDGAPLIGYPLEGPLPIDFDQQQQLLQQAWIVQGGQVHRIRLGGHQIAWGTKGGSVRPPGTKGGIGSVPIGGPIGEVGSVGGIRGSISVPVLSQHSLQVVPVPVQAPYFNAQPQLVSVEPSVQAVQLLFKSASSPLLVRQKHYGLNQGSLYQVTRSEDNPHVLRHEVLKPVLQEVREIIQPFRQVTQQVNPVLERVHTLVPHRQYLPPTPGQVFKAGHHQGGGEYLHHGQQQQQQGVQQRVHFFSENSVQDYQQPIQQEPIQQEPIEQEPIQQEPIEQAPIKGRIV